MIIFAWDHENRFANHDYLSTEEERRSVSGRSSSLFTRCSSVEIRRQWRCHSHSGRAVPTDSVPMSHDDVIKWKYFPRHCPFVREIHRWPVDCFTSHVGEHRTACGLWKKQGIPCFFKIPTVQQSPEEETSFVYVTLATHVTLATAGYTPCLFGYVTIGLTRHNRTHFSQSERLLVKPQRPCTDLCAEPAGCGTD